MSFEVQHPIPQEITSYQFRLVGDMTLKQFFQVAAGALIALLLYSTNLLAFVKVPLMTISFLFGIALAFFPLEDRPLEKWLFLFFKSIYSPTIFTWIKTKPLSFFASDEEMQATLSEKQTPAQIQKQMAQPTPPEPLESTLAPVGIQLEATKALSSLESGEKQMLINITEHMENSAAAKEVGIPATTPIAITKIASQNTENVIKDVEITDNDVTNATSRVEGFVADKQNTNAKQAIFSQESAPPIPPTQPNILVGQVMDNSGKIIDGAILEIRDFENRPARALKSNKLGHFGIVTPLSNGAYEIITEKEGFMFESVRLNVEGKIIEPIAISASGKMPLN